MEKWYWIDKEKGTIHFEIEGLGHDYVMDIGKFIDRYSKYLTDEEWDEIFGEDYDWNHINPQDIVKAITIMEQNELFFDELNENAFYWYSHEYLRDY